MFLNFAVYKILFFDHDKRSHRDFGGAGRIADDGGDKAGQPHGAKVNVTASESFGRCHAVVVGIDAVFVRKARNTAQFTAGAAIAVLIESKTVSVRYGTAKSCRYGKSPGTGFGQFRVKMKRWCSGFGCHKNLQSYVCFQYAFIELVCQVKKTKIYQTEHFYTRNREKKRAIIMPKA